MKKKRRNVLVYIDDPVKCYTEMTIQVDDIGGEWLSPGQVDFLEYAHLWARYECSNRLKALRKTVTYWELPTPYVDTPVTRFSATEFTRSTPAFNNILV